MHLLYVSAAAGTDAARSLADVQAQAGPDVPITVAGRAGDPAEEILRYARRRGVLVVAALEARSTALGLSLLRGLPASNEVSSAASAAGQGFARGMVAPTEILVRGPGLGQERSRLEQEVGDWLDERGVSATQVINRMRGKLSHVPGATLYLPIPVDGALFSAGDCHALQGDGEVSGTAIEAPTRAQLTLDLQDEPVLEWPVARLDGAWITLYHYASRALIRPSVKGLERSPLSTAPEFLAPLRKVYLE